MNIYHSSDFADSLKSILMKDKPGLLCFVFLNGPLALINSARTPANPECGRSDAACHCFYHPVMFISAVRRAVCSVRIEENSPELVIMKRPSPKVSCLVSL